MKIKEQFTARQDFGYRFISSFQKMVNSLFSYVYIGLGDGEERLANAKSIIGALSLRICEGMEYSIIVMNDNDDVARSDMTIIKEWIRANEV